MVDSVCPQGLPEMSFINCSPDTFFKNGVLEIKCNEPVSGFIKGVQKLGKSTHAMSISFSIAGRKAKALRKQLNALGRTPKPYKYYGERYNNLSLKRKLAAKIILKTIYKYY